MIEQLNGIHETVVYKTNTNIRLYDNNKFESYPLHWHTPLEIIMPISNQYTVTIGTSSQKLNPYDIILISPGIIHSLTAPPFGRRIIFQAELNFFRQLNEFNNILNFISPTTTITPTNSPELHDFIKQKLLNIVEEYKSNDSFSEVIIYSDLLDILVSLVRDKTTSIDTPTITKSFQPEYMENFIGICHYIDEHCTEDLSLDQIAQLAGFSKYHFTRLFKQFTNVTFYKYLTLQRIAHAEELLINPQLSITEVALQSGFSNQSAFIRMFKLIKLCTPSEFRNMYSSS